MDLYQFNAKHYLKDINLHGNGKNVLIIEHTILTPDQDCGSKYMFHFIKTLLIRRHKKSGILKQVYTSNKIRYYLRLEYKARITSSAAAFVKFKYASF